MNESFFSWKTPEYVYRVKTADWYWSVAIISIASSVTAFLLGNTLFALVLIVGIFTLLLYSARSPQIIDVEVLNTGIRAGKYVYPYHEMEAFWIALYHNHERLLLKSKKRFAPLVSVLIPEEVHLEELRDFLTQKMQEVELKEPLIQHLLEYIGF
ncbi:MAG: hypothetical protein RJA61_508 [Candidatus Parcubacteria bacterium]|jgi:hypothetical protein